MYNNTKGFVQMKCFVYIIVMVILELSLHKCIQFVVLVHNIDMGSTYYRSHVSHKFTYTRTEHWRAVWRSL